MGIVRLAGIRCWPCRGGLCSTKPVIRVYYKVLEMYGGAQVLGRLALRDEAGALAAANGVVESINYAKGL